MAAKRKSSIAQARLDDQVTDMAPEPEPETAVVEETVHASYVASRAAHLVESASAFEIVPSVHLGMSLNPPRSSQLMPMALRFAAENAFLTVLKEGILVSVLKSPSTLTEAAAEGLTAWRKGSAAEHNAHISAFAPAPACYKHIMKYISG